jgi:YbbR domain-containing protein
MKQILLHNWKIKLTCLVLAFVVWYLIQHNVNPAGEPRTRAKSGQTKE